MSTVFPDRLRIGDLVYVVDSTPLETYLAALPEQPPRRASPFSQRGYVATWTIHEDTMYLAEITSQAHALLFAERPGPVAASWFSGFIHGWRGAPRYTGYPARTFYNDEIVLEISTGVVVREWLLDLRGVPDQTGEELQQSVPAFLLKARPD